MQIKGNWHPQGRAVRLSAAFLCQNDRFTLEIEDGETIYGLLGEITVSSRLGNIERKLILKDGSVFSSYENDAIDQLIKPIGNTSGFIHSFESKFRWVILALVVTLFSGYAFFKWGIPWASTQVAHALPQKTNELIAEGTLDFLDKYLFDESELNVETRERIRSHFASSLISLENNSDINYTLHFRNWSANDKDIPNAFALPSGDIILTDKFVDLSESQAEIDSVLLHEMGHVAHRHTLQMVIEGTLVTTVVLLATGDLSSIADLSLGVGSFLISSHYSRGHESEADEYAFKKMLLANIDPENFSNIMSRMSAYMEAQQSDEVASQDDKKKDSSRNDNQEERIFDYLSTHPSTEKRLERAKHYSECFKKGMAECE